MAQESVAAPSRAACNQYTSGTVRLPSSCRYKADLLPFPLGRSATCLSDTAVWAWWVSLRPHKWGEVGLASPDDGSAEYVELSAFLNVRPGFTGTSYRKRTAKPIL